MAPPVKKPSKPVFKTSSPFTETKWPQISPEDEEIIVELLCNLLAPLGAHRAAHLPPSKGKSAKRKRPTPTPETAPPPPPDLKNHLLIGLNSVTRHLEARAAARAPAALKEGEEEDAAEEKKGEEEDASKESKPEQSKERPLSIVILTHPQPALSPAHAHIPTLLHLSTLSTAPDATSSQTRLVALPTSTDARLAASLHIPRVGAVGIYEGAPGAKGLEDYVRQHVGITECPWVDEAMRAEWKGLNVVGGKTKE